VSVAYSGIIGKYKAVTQGVDVTKRDHLLKVIDQLEVVGRAYWEIQNGLGIDERTGQICPLKSSYEEAGRILEGQSLEFMLKGSDSNSVVNLVRGYWNLHWALRDVSHDVAMVISKIYMLLNKEFSVREELRLMMNATEKKQVEDRKAY